MNRKIRETCLLFQKKFIDYGRFVLYSLKWIVFAVLCGVIIGTAAALFAIAIKRVTAWRLVHRWVILFLPLAGCVIVWLYHAAGMDRDKGTNTVLDSIHDNRRIRIAMAPLIYVSTILTHLFGGSAGREGAALQMGGSMGIGLARVFSWFRFQKEDRSLIIMCGMSAAFSALFGTPMAAAILSLEISTVGIMYDSALVPCVFSSLTAYGISRLWRLTPERFPVFHISSVTPRSIFFLILLSILSALVSVLFVTALKMTGKLFQKLLPGRYVRVVVSGLLIIGLTLLTGSFAYNGSGVSLIEKAVMEGGEGIVWYAFLLKMLFTAITLEGGYKGGEIVPALSIGACFGAAFAQLFHLDGASCAALGMGAVFCGVTNCPIASLLICFELCGFEATPYYLIAISLSYLFSGNFGIYSSQIIRYAKHRIRQENRPAHM